MKLRPKSHIKASKSFGGRHISPSYELDFSPIELTNITSSFSSTDSCIKRALYFKNKGNTKEAIISYKEALEKEPLHYGCLVNLGLLSYSLNQREDAIALLDKAINVNRQKPEAYFNKALIYYNSKEYYQALRVLNNYTGSDFNYIKKLKCKCLLKSTESLETPLRTNPFEVSNVKDKKPSHRKQVMSYDFNMNTSKLSVPSKLSSPIKTRKTKSRINVYNEKTLPVYYGRSRNSNPRSRPQTPEIKQSIDCIQSDLSKVQRKRNILNELELLENIKKKLGIFKQSVITDQRTETPKKEDVRSQALTVKELKLVKFEFELPPEIRNYKQLETLLKKLHFFNKFPSSVRMDLIKVSSVGDFPIGHVMFSEGDAGDDIYVIVKGCVAVQRQLNDYGKNPIILTSLYDGSQFGEISLANTKNPSSKAKKRNATCIVTEESTILSLPREQYQQILMKELHQDIEEKVKFLIKIPCFKGLDPNLIMPLAASLDTATYQLNEAIIKKGEIPKGLYIIYEGHAVACTEAYAIREKYSGSFSNSRRRGPKPTPFYTGNLNPPPDVSLKRDRTLHRIKQSCFNELENPHTLKRSLSDQINGEKYLVNERMPFATVKEFDYFGGRALLDDLKPAKFSIIVQSSLARVFIMSSYHLNYLNDVVLEQLRTVLARSYEVDCPDDVDPQSMDKMIKYWNGRRNELCEHVWRTKFLERNPFPSS